MAYTCGAQNRFCGLERRAILTAASFPPSLHRPQDALGEKPCSLTVGSERERDRGFESGAFNEKIHRTKALWIFWSE